VLAGSLERYTRLYKEAGVAVLEADIDALQDSYALISTMMNRLPDPVAEPDKLNGLVQRLTCLTDHAVDKEFDCEADEPQPVDDVNVGEDNEFGIRTDAHVDVNSSGHEEGHQDGNLSTSADSEDDPYANLDQELLEIFLEESLENLEVCDSSLAAWRESADDSEALLALQRALHTLKGGARMADLNAIGDLSHAVESLIIAIDAGDAGADSDAMDAVQQAQDHLTSMIEAVQSRRPMQSVDKLIAKLAALRQRAPVAVAENRSPAEEAVDTFSVTGLFALPTATAAFP
jgi:chemosensory pili system protein ChpA (sensor histidine kinase/response regulator)